MSNSTIEDVVEHFSNEVDVNSDNVKELLDDEQYILLLQQLLSSKNGLLSMEEIIFRNSPVVGEEMVRNDIEHLCDTGYIETVEPDVDTIPNDKPSVFFTPSKVSLCVMNKIGLLNTSGMMYQVYNELERTDEIEEIEQWDGRPFPDWYPN